MRSGYDDDDNDAISLQSIGLEHEGVHLARTDTEQTEEYDDYAEDEESSYGLTSHAGRLSGAVYGLGGPRAAPKTPSRSERQSLKLPNTGSVHTYYGSPTRNRGRSPSPLGRKVSSAVHKASARIVNISNDENHIDDHRSSNNNSPTLPENSPGKDYFSSTRSLHSPEPEVQLQGKTVGLFTPENKLRRALCELLLNPFVEPCILLLIVFQAILLTIESSLHSLSDNSSLRWGKWTDWAMLTVFVLYTLEIMVRVIVSGLLLNPDNEVSSLLFKQYRQRLQIKKKLPPVSVCAKVACHFKPMTNESDSRDRRKEFILRTAYLRHSFNRIDFTSVCSFWIYLALAVTDLEFKHHLFLFKAVSCVRILRLLNVTRGTSTILKSLKKAAPLLLKVAFFVGTFWIFIAIVGVQAFKGSFRRQCVWVDPLGIEANQTQDLQFCGGQWQNGIKTTHLIKDWSPSIKTKPKGYICPEQSWCVQDANPYNGTVHFDNVLGALELVFVIMSSNTFTDLMYYTMDSDYFISAVFFIIGTLILTFWLMSLVIAVVTTSFQVIREEQHSSAFTAPGTGQPTSDLAHRQSKCIGLKYWSHTKWFWILLVIADLTVQAFKTSSMSTTTWAHYEIAETIFTSIFALEIVCRFACHLPDWRAFATKSNIADLVLAVVTCFIQIPLIKNSGSFYRWLTIFQILRFYRIIQAIPLTRELLGRILGKATGLLNLIFFVFCSVYIGALIASQLIRGDAPTEVYGESQEITFKNTYNAFIGMYQVLTSENWTTILYAIQMNQATFHQSWVGAVFFIIWFVFSQNILMSMFIAVLQENFEVSEDDKRVEQVKAFVQRTLPTGPNSDQTTLTMFSLLRNHRKKIQRQSHNVTTLGTIMQEDNVREFLDQQVHSPKGRAAPMKEQLQGPIKGLIKRVKSFLAKYRVEWTQKRHNPFTSRINLSKEAAASALDASTLATEVAKAHADRKTQQAAYLEENPDYDKVLWTLGPNSSIRRFCQKIVAPSTGERMDVKAGPVPLIWYVFTATMYLSTVALVVLACIVTPTYQKLYVATHAGTHFSWFTWCDLGFTIIFSAEFLVKLLADGFWFTPNAYFRDTWNKIDFLVLITLWINLIADILNRGALSRAFRAFKALRALRLVNISDATRRTFHDVLIAGFWNIAGAALVSVILLVPMAVWGLNMFAGLLFSCNDGLVDNSTACYNEFASRPNNWDIWTPRSWENPQGWNFDSFGSSLLILFEIVSQEGWTNVMTSAMAITGKGDQPTQDASAINAVFFIIFNLLGAVFVLTLFIAVIIQNYSERSGIAYLTVEQRSWQEMRLLLKQVTPSRRPLDAPTARIRRWCWFAVKKHSTWNRTLIVIYCAHTLVLMSEHFPEPLHFDLMRNTIFLVFTLIYIINLVIRVLGLGWVLFLRSRWNIYNLIVVTITFVLSVIQFQTLGDTMAALLTADKVFLVMIAANLIPANDSLDQLLKTTAGSLPDLASLMATWLVLFVTFAIAMNQIFGLTKIGVNGTDNLNFRSIPKALVLLFRMSCGEGWNEIMHDYAVEEPYCTSDSDFYNTDCGSTTWAYFLFIAWNILSMYIFVNIVISLVYNNFSYVYQQAGNMSSISRSEIRRFKATWAEFDDGSGHIAKSQIARFLSRLDGAFEVRIYPAECSVKTIQANCHKIPDIGSSKYKKMDMIALKHMIDMMDVAEIRRRRRSFNRLYTELMEHPSTRGISFTAMLLIISHNKFVDENKSLGLAEFLHRRRTRLEVDRKLSQECIVSFLESIPSRQSLRKHLAESRTAATIPTLKIPEHTTLTRYRSTSPLSFASGLKQHSYIGQQSASSRTSDDRSRRASIPPLTPRELVEGLDYDSLLAGSAWSSAIYAASGTEASDDEN